MKRRLIVVGDVTEDGGSVLTGAPFSGIGGNAVARVGDKVHCGLHQRACSIVTGDEHIRINGKAVAREGDRLACGCILRAQRQQLVFAGTERAARRSGFWAAETFAPNRPDTAVAAFDQAIRFEGPDGTPLAGLKYTLRLEDGTERAGVTDAQGTTQRVSTAECTAICSAALSAPQSPGSSCCRGSDAHEPEVIAVRGVTTTTEDIGTSVSTVKPEAIKRKLTPGEIKMARLVFKDSIDYSKVRIHNRGYWLFFGLQRENVAVAPNGQIYFKGVHYKDDFSAAYANEQAWFMHEMTHVWQYQHGYPVKSARLRDLDMSYLYRLQPGKHLSSLNMEAQAALIADYFLLLASPKDEKGNASTSVAGKVLEDYNVFLKDFIERPADRKHLPTKEPE